MSVVMKKLVEWENKWEITDYIWLQNCKRNNAVIRALKIVFCDAFRKL